MKGGNTICRFNYPLPPFNNTIILDPNPDSSKAELTLYHHIQRYLDYDVITEDTTLEQILQHFNIGLDMFLLLGPNCSLAKYSFAANLLMRIWICTCRIYSIAGKLKWTANSALIRILLSFIVNYINKQNRGLSVALQTMVDKCQNEGKEIQEIVRKLGVVFQKSVVKKLYIARHSLNFLFHSNNWYSYG